MEQSTLRKFGLQKGKPKTLDSEEERRRRYGNVLMVRVWISLKGQLVVMPAMALMRVARVGVTAQVWRITPILLSTLIDSFPSKELVPLFFFFFWVMCWVESMVPFMVGPNLGLIG